MPGAWGRALSTILTKARPAHSREPQRRRLLQRVALASGAWPDTLADEAQRKLSPGPTDHERTIRYVLSRGPRRNQWRRSQERLASRLALARSKHRRSKSEWIEKLAMKREKDHWA